MKNKYKFAILILVALVIFLIFAFYDQGFSIGSWGRNRTIMSRPKKTIQIIKQN